MHAKTCGLDLAKRVFQMYWAKGPQPRGVSFLAAMAGVGQWGEGCARCRYSPIPIHPMVRLAGSHVAPPPLIFCRAK